MHQLFDGYGRPYTPKKRPERSEIAVASIRDRFSSYPTSGLTPERLAAIFKEADQGDVYRQAELFEEMEEKDTHLFSILQTRKLAVCGCDLKIIAASDSAEDKRIAEVVTELIDNCDKLDEALFDLLDAIGKGYAGSEIMWDIGDRIGIRDIKWKHAKRFTFYDDKQLLEYPRLLTDANPGRGEDLQPNKFVFHRYRARSGATARGGILRTCAWMYLFKNFGIKDWVVFAEVYGMPLRLGRYDAGASKEDRAALITAVQSLGSDAAGVISKTTEIEFIESVKNARGDIYQLLTKFCNDEMSKAVLGQLATTEGTPGKLGGDDAQDKVRQDLKEADARALAKTLRMQLIRPLVGFNFGWDSPLPKVKLLFEAPEDLFQTAQTYETLAKGGLKTIPVKHVHEKFGIPMPLEGEETMGGQQAEPDSKEAAPVQKPGVIVSKQNLQNDSLDEWVDKALAKMSAPQQDWLEPVKKLVLSGGSLEEIKTSLLDAYPELEPKQMGDLMQRAFTLSELLGRWEAK